MRELNRSGQNISAEEILALREELQRNQQNTSLNLMNNNINSTDAIAALGAALQGTNVTSLDLSHTGLPRGQLLSLVSEFRYLHHVGIDGELPVIAEELGLNRASNINPPAAAAAGQVSPGFAGSIIASRNAQAAAAASVPVMELPVIAEELGLNRASNINPPAAAAAAGQVSPVVVGPHTQSIVAARSAVESPCCPIL
jgi:hypothetical protein